MQEKKDGSLSAGLEELTSLADLVRFILARAGLTEAQAARRVEEVSADTIKGWVQGYRTPSWRCLKALIVGGGLERELPRFQARYEGLKLTVNSEQPFGPLYANLLTILKHPPVEGLSEGKGRAIKWKEMEIEKLLGVIAHCREAEEKTDPRDILAVATALYNATSGLETHGTVAANAALEAGKHLRAIGNYTESVRYLELARDRAIGIGDLMLGRDALHSRMLTVEAASVDGVEAALGEMPSLEAFIGETFRNERRVGLNYRKAMNELLRDWIRLATQACTVPLLARLVERHTLICDGLGDARLLSMNAEIHARANLALGKIDRARDALDTARTLGGTGTDLDGLKRRRTEALCVAAEGKADDAIDLLTAVEAECRARGFVGNAEKMRHSAWQLKAARKPIRTSHPA